MKEKEIKEDQETKADSKTAETPTPQEPVSYTISEPTRP